MFHQKGGGKEERMNLQSLKKSEKFLYGLLSFPPRRAPSDLGDSKPAERKKSLTGEAGSLNDKLNIAPGSEAQKRELLNFLSRGVQVPPLINGRIKKKSVDRLNFLDQKALSASRQCGLRKDYDVRLGFW